MKGKCMLLLLSLAISNAAIGSEAKSASESDGKQQRVGLVLSGGGARGIAEIAFIQALEENGIPIDYITGTSIGAIVGGLYASGYSPEEMMQLIKSKTFTDASQGIIDPKYTYLFLRPEQKPTMLNLNMSSDMSMSPILPSSLISPMPMNFSFMAIFARYTAQCHGDFNKLFVPLRTIASDMTNKRRKVWSHGQLTDAVRSSMSFPVVFKPVTHDGSLLYDGGIFDNYPIDVMREEFNPDIMIGVDIHSTDTLHAFPDVLQQMDMLVIRPQSYEMPESDGISVRIDLNKFSLLDFAKADEIYAAGYRKGLEMIDSIKRRVTARRPASVVAARRKEFRKATPLVFFDSVAVSGGTPAQNDYIRHIFTSEHPDTFGLRSTYESYVKVVSTGRLKDLDPEARFNPSTGTFALYLDTEIKKPIDIGIGGYVTSSANSMLYLSGSYNSLSMRALSASLSGWIGQSYLAGKLDARLMLRRRQVSSMGFEAAVWRQKFYESDKLFYQDDSPAFITNMQAFARIKYSRATSLHNILSLGVAYGHLDDRFYNNDESIVSNSTDRNKTIRDLGQLSVRWNRNTLDDPMLPLQGTEIGVLGQAVWERFDFIQGSQRQRILSPSQKGHDKWLQIEASLRQYISLSSRWSLGIESTVLASTHHLLDNYNAAIVNTPSFNPTAASFNVFNPRLRANSFVTAGIVPVYKFSDRLSARLSAHAFLPMRPISQNDEGMACYGDWFSKAAFYSELSASFKLPFGILTAYGNYQTTPGTRWGVGISFGYFILAPNMLRL